SSDLISNHHIFFEILQPCKPPRDLRSSDKVLLTEPLIKSALGRRSFSYAAPHIWNMLPDYLRNATSLYSFTLQLKTHCSLRLIFSLRKHYYFFGLITR